MIIDLILNRKDGDNYDPHNFYLEVMDYEALFNFDRSISYAMDHLEEAQVKRALCDYITNNNYNENIKDYIKSVNWL